MIVVNSEVTKIVGRPYEVMAETTEILRKVKEMLKEAFDEDVAKELYSELLRVVEMSDEEINEAVGKKGKSNNGAVRD